MEFVSEPHGPPGPGFISLIPSLGERDVFTQPVLTVWIVQPFPLGALCPEPCSSPRGSSLGKCGHRAPAPKWALQSWKVGAGLQVNILGGPFHLLDGDPTVPFSGLLRVPGEAKVGKPL